MFKYVLDAATLQFTFRVVSAHVSYQIENVIIILTSNYGEITSPFLAFRTIG